MTPILLLLFQLVPSPGPPDFSMDVYNSQRQFVGECDLTNDGHITTCVPAAGFTPGDIWTAALLNQPTPAIILDWKTYRP